jgi:hypothetical protein
MKPAKATGAQPAPLWKPNLPGRATHAPGLRPSTAGAPLCGAPPGARLASTPLGADCRRCLAHLDRIGYRCPCVAEAIPCFDCTVRAGATRAKKGGAK